MLVYVFDDGGKWFKLTLYGLEEVTSGVQSGVGTMIAFGGESHRGSIAATSAGLDIIGPRRVPPESEEHRPVASIIVVVVLDQARGNGVVYGLVIGLLGDEDAFAAGDLVGVGALVLAEAVVGACTGEEGDDAADQSRVAAGLGLAGVGEATAGLLAEGGLRDEGGGPLQRRRNGAAQCACEGSCCGCHCVLSLWM